MIPTFLKLVRWGIGHVDGDVTMPDRVDWKRMLPLAARQGLSAVVLDGVEEWKRMAEESGKGDAAAIATAGEGGANAGRGREESQAFPPAGVLVPWVGEVFQNYERRYGLYQRTLGEMASFYEDHGLKMMVLKGYACSLDWPRPEHRPAGDIDIWLFGEYKRADELLQREKGIAVDTRIPPL